MSLKEFTPKFFSLLRKGIEPRQVRDDILAGLVVGIVALPLSIALAIASGVSPEKGILTAIISGFIISFLGGSRVQIGGPTGAFVVMVFTIQATHGLEGLLIATFMAGVMLVIMGLLKLGSLLKFIPQSLIVGFTSAIGLLIFTIQIKDFLGLRIEKVPVEFLEKLEVYAHHLHTLNPWAIGVGLVTILMIVLLPRLSKKIPWTFIALVLMSVVVFVFKIPVDTIYTQFGDLNSHFPRPAFFKLDWDTIQKLIVPAFSIALLGGLESLLSAVVADSMIGVQHRSNIELVAQGLANMVSPLFGGIPATGAIARTATNVNQGGRTPIAGMVHALVLLLIFFIAMPVVKYIPMAVLAGILMVVAWKMSDVKNFIHSCRLNIFEALVLLTTFTLTVLVDLVVAIPVGFVLAVLLFMKRSADAVAVNPLMFEKTDDETLFHQEIGHYSDQVVIFELNGPLFFGSMHHILNILPQLEDRHHSVVLSFLYVPIIDMTGLTRLRDFARDVAARKTRLYISGAQPKVADELLKFGIVSAADIFTDLKTAVRTAEENSQPAK